MRKSYSAKESGSSDDFLMIIPISTNGRVETRLMPFVPCFPAFFDLLISLGQKGGTHNYSKKVAHFLKKGLNKWEFSHSQQNRVEIWSEELEH